MDFATIVGLIIAFGAVVVAGWAGGTDPRVFVSRWDALVLVLGGTIGATMISFPIMMRMTGRKWKAINMFLPRWPSFIAKRA